MNLCLAKAEHRVSDEGDSTPAEAKNRNFILWKTGVLEFDKLNTGNRQSAIGNRYPAFVNCYPVSGTAPEPALVNCVITYRQVPDTVCQDYAIRVICVKIFPSFLR